MHECVYPTILAGHSSYKSLQFQLKYFNALGSTREMETIELEFFNIINVSGDSGSENSHLQLSLTEENLKRSFITTHCEREKVFLSVSFVSIGHSGIAQGIEASFKF